MRILIVEDNFLIVLLLEDAVERAGHEVVATASSAAEARRAIADNPQIHLALVDIDLDDGRTGVGLATELALRFEIPTVFATGQGAVARANANCAMAVLEKPFTETDIIQTLEVIERLINGERPCAGPRNLELLAGPRRMGRQNHGAPSIRPAAPS